MSWKDPDDVVAFGGFAAVAGAAELREAGSVVTGAPSFHDLTITVRVQVTDPTAVLSDPSVMRFSIGRDGETGVYLPSSVEEAVVARFTALLDQMYQPSRGMVICEHSEQLAAWNRNRNEWHHPDGGSPDHGHPANE